MGFKGIRIDSPDDVVPVLDRAMASLRPIVVDMRANPNVLLMPPQTTLEQAKNFFQALAKGDPDAGAVLKQLARQLSV